MTKNLLISLFSITSIVFPLAAATLEPSSVTLSASQQVQFTLTGWVSPGPIYWWISPANMGSISSTGYYVAPSSGSGVVFVHAWPSGTLASYVSSITLSGAAAPTTPSAPMEPTTTPITVTVTPTSSLVPAGQSVNLTARVAGTSNQQVTWLLNPQLGTIQNGLYTAPASFSGNDVVVTAVATSKANPSAAGSATLILAQPVSVSAPQSNVSISVGPSGIKLTPGQSAQFSASIQGTTNTGVNWSLSPQVGSISNGYYTAPGSISAQQSVTVTATSSANSSKTASVALVLQPISNPAPPVSNVAISVSPGTASLTGGQSATFSPLVTGSSNSAVTWSISPQVGSISNGTYKAPSIIASQQNVTVTATSAADTTKSASATVSLQPIAVTLGPSSISLSAGQSNAFSATVTGTANTSVSWSVSPSVGSVTNGVYTAPGTISSSQKVAVTATSTVDTTKSASATITLVASPSNPSNPTPPSNASTTTVTLPLEVLGANGTTVSASVNIPTGSNLSGQMSLYMQIHGLRSETQASVQVNNSGWMPISHSTVTLAGNATAYGGIGGGFSTLKMTMNLPAGLVQSGTNTISFRFNQTDGRVSGFRVLAFNVQDVNGNSLIPASAFVQDDPDNWQPPSTSASDISAGQTLWHTASLTAPNASGGTTQIQAHCADCHTQDGRDLKYFNYSNNSIQARSVFHGLTAQQGNQIASYIRSLNVPNPGRVWNPPYQPGPGLDEGPVSNWAAGAGLDAVLDTDQEMLNAMFPSGIQSSVFASTSRLNQRELQLALQLPDWNQWLPGTHPMDAFGSSFTNSPYNTIYQQLAATLQVGNAAVYVQQAANFGNWFDAFFTLRTQLGTPMWNASSALTAAQVDSLYSLAQWGMVKNFEFNSQFQLEGLAQNVLGPQADPRAWDSALPFYVSPHELNLNIHSPTGGALGLRNGTSAVETYLAYIWYNVQLILNDSNGVYSFQNPIDWNYANNYVKGMGQLSDPQGGIQTMWLIKALQVLNQNGTGPQNSGEGWMPNAAQISWLINPDWNYYVWGGADPATRVTIATNLVQSWLSAASQWTPQQYYAGNFTTASAVPVPGGNPDDQIFIDWVWYMIPRFKYIGVNPGLVSQLAHWAQTVWPAANWTNDLNATCWNDSGYSYQIDCNQ